MDMLNLPDKFELALKSGGIEGVLITFADTIRTNPNDGTIHSRAFALLLKFSKTNSHHLNKFLYELNGLKLIEFVLTHPICIISRPMLDRYLDYCLVKTPGNLALIESPNLIYHLLSGWRAWHKDLRVAKILYKKLARLIQDPNETVRNRNLEMLNAASGLDILMGILRDCLIPLDEVGPNIDYEIVEMIVNLIDLLIRQPVESEMLLDIMEFLLFLHPDPKAYIETTSDRSFSQINGKDKYYLNRLSQSEDFFPFVDSKTRLTSSMTRNYNDQELESDISYSNNHLDYNHQYKMNNIISNNMTSEVVRSHNRNYAIALIADMLATKIKQISTDPDNILSDALKKCELDPRKLILLANNESPLVREKVLRLFLYCVWACYTLNLKNILNKFELDTKTTAAFRSCLPIQLIGLQLIKYPTTMKMIQLCYGIIVGDSITTGNFETFETVCLNFDIEFIDSATKYTDLQFNALILLIKLVPQLQEPEEIEASVKFIYAYFKQLLKLGEEELVTSFIKSTLVDSLMRLYFCFVENELNRYQLHNDAIRIGEESSEGDFGSVKQELDRVLVMICQHYIQNLPNDVSIRSIEDLLLYFELMNSHVPPKHHQLLRDRKVKILLTSLRYCRHYETCARKRICTWRDYYLSFFGDITFSNVLSDYQLELSSDECSLSYLTSLSSADNNNSNDSNNEVQDSSDRQSNLSNQSQTEEGNVSPVNLLNGGVAVPNNNNSNKKPDDSLQLLFGGAKRYKQVGEDDESVELIQYVNKDLTELQVIDRFKATFELITSFIMSREPGAIPSPLERRFILKCIKLLSSYIKDHQVYISSPKKNKNRCQWNSLMLPKLIKLFKENFSNLILYLLCGYTNLDERKYYAQTLLEMFGVEQLIKLLDDGNDRTVHRLLLGFVRELIEFNRSPSESDFESGGERQSSEDNDETRQIDISDQEDEILEDETESQLRSLAGQLEFVLQTNDWQANTATTTTSNRTTNANGNSVDANPLTDNQKFRADIQLKLDAKLCEVWLNDLTQRRYDLKDRVESMKLEQSTRPSSALVSESASLAGDISSVNSVIGGEETVATLASLTEEAFKITDGVVANKHDQQKAYFDDFKQNKVNNYHIRQQWLSLIIGHTHERSMWYSDTCYPKSWELNPVEGPSRIRRRLRPCKLNLDSKFLRQNLDTDDASVEMESERRNRQQVVETRSSSFESEDNINLMINNQEEIIGPHPLCSMFADQESNSIESNELRTRMFTADKINFNCDCSLVRPNEVFEGEILIADWCIHFIGQKTETFQQTTQMEDSIILDRYQRGKTANVDLTSLDITKPHQLRVARARRKRSLMSTLVEDLWFDEIVEIWDRRYQLQDVGLEIFLTNNMTYLISFKTNRDREDFNRNLMKEQPKMINLQQFNLKESLKHLTQLWRDGRLTNFDYLTCLNKLAGRSFNDLMQYPVFPFILSNYTSDQLDLNKEENFRNLKKSMAVQNPEKEAYFTKNYQLSQATNLSVGPCGVTKPYHYSNHYSNSATVLHFLVRLPPFTQMLIQYQDNNFDQPDRTFHSIASTWQLITRDSNTDFKELIPELFFLPEMFVNLEQFELGRRQNGELVDDVKLPAWCPNSDARLFTLIHRQALESAQVSEHLHHWIDLIFGYKQTGKAAVEAINVFHPATYYGEIDLTSINTTGGPSSLSLLQPSLTKTTANSSNYSSGTFISTTADDGSNNQVKQMNLEANIRRQQQLQAEEIERSALETMIKTYGQMPRQLFEVPTKQRNPSTFARPQSQNPPELQYLNYNQEPAQMASIDGFPAHAGSAGGGKRLEPLRQVRGLKWGSYVGSPDEQDLVVVRHMRILPEEEQEQQVAQSATSKSSGQHQQARIRRQSDRPESGKFLLHLLPNGEIAIMRSNSSLMLDYKAYRKSGGSYQLSLPSTRYSKRAGYSSVAKMNLFSNMVIGSSRQHQFGSMEPAGHQVSSSSHHITYNTFSPSFLSITAPRFKFSPDSLNLVSWSKQEGTIRIKHRAMSNKKPSDLLVKANTVSDSMSTCCSVPELNLLLVGYQSGSICAHIVSTSYEARPSSIVSSQLHSSTPTSQLLAQAAYNNAMRRNMNQRPRPHSVATGGSSGSRGVFSNGNTKNKSKGEKEGGESRKNKSIGSTSISMTTTTSSSANSVTFGSASSLNDSLTFMSRSPPSIGGESHLLPSMVSFAAPPLSSTRGLQTSGNTINKTSRWLYCHSRRVNCITINVSFGVVVSGSDDGTSVIWDLNSLTYVRTIDYRLDTTIGKKYPPRDSQTDSTQANRQTQRKYRYSYRAQSPFFANQRLLDYLCSCNMNNHSTRAEQLAVATRRESTPSSATTPSLQAVAKKCSICGSGIKLIAISNTLGDIVTVKHINNRLALATSLEDDQRQQQQQKQQQQRYRDADQMMTQSERQRPSVDLDEIDGELDETVNQNNENNNEDDENGSNRNKKVTEKKQQDQQQQQPEANCLSSVVYVHTINGTLVGSVYCHTQVTAVSYSHAPEGISVNVIVLGLADGSVRLYSSWDLSRVQEFRLSGLGSPISSLLYSRDNQLLYMAYEDGQLVVLRSKKKGSISLPKEWFL